MAGNTNFPTSLDSHTGASPLGFGEVNNQAYTLSTADHSNSATTITVASTSKFQSKGYLVIKREIVSYTGTTSTTFTGVTRGVGGTTAAAFLSGTLVEQVPVAANHNDLAAAIVAVEHELILRRQAEILVNSNFDHWQRGASARTNTTTYNRDTSFAADRFFARPVGASITTQRSTTVPDNNSRYSALLTGASSVTTVDYGQRLSAQVAHTQMRRSLVFSCYVRNVSGASFTPTLRIGTAGAADDFTTTTNRLDQALQECADSAWTQVYHVFDPSAYTNLSNGVEVCLRIPSGSLVAGDTVYISQFSLKPGIALSPYTPPDPDVELMRCLPYCRIMGANGNGTYNAATRILLSQTFDPPMRAAPIATLLTSAFQIVELGVGFQTGSSSTIVGSSLWPRGAYLDIDGFTGLTADKEIRVVSADVAAFSAEFA